MKIKNGYVYVKTTGKTYWIENDAYLMSYWGYRPLKCHHNFWFYPKVFKDFTEIE